MLALALCLQGAGARARPAAPGAGFRQGLIFVHASVNGGPQGVFLIDTGAGETVIDVRYAAATRVKLGDPMSLHGGGGFRDARQGENARLSLLGQTALVDPVVADLLPIANGMGERLDGIVGDDFLARFAVELDYRNQRVTLHSGDAVSPPPGALSMRLAHTPFVVARVTQGGHSATAEFQIDTGSNTALTLWRGFNRAVFPDLRGSHGMGMGVGGQTFDRRTRIDALEVAGKRISDLGAVLDDDTRPDDADRSYGGVIGGPAWAGLIVELDFPRGMFWLR